MFKESLFKDQFMNSLPIAGESGTMAYLGKGTVIEGNVLAKSGSMARIRCYSGYILKEEKTYILTVMLNNFDCTGSESRKKIEKLLIDIYPELD